MNENPEPEASGPSSTAVAATGGGLFGAHALLGGLAALGPVGMLAVAGGVAGLGAAGYMTSRKKARKPGFLAGTAKRATSSKSGKSGLLRAAGLPKSRSGAAKAGGRLGGKKGGSLAAKAARGGKAGKLPLKGTKLGQAGKGSGRGGKGKGSGSGPGRKGSGSKGGGLFSGLKGRGKSASSRASKGGKSPKSGSGKKSKGLFGSLMAKRHRTRAAKSFGTLKAIAGKGKGLFSTAKGKPKQKGIVRRTASFLKFWKDRKPVKTPELETPKPPAPVKAARAASLAARVVPEPTGRRTRFASRYLAKEAAQTMSQHPLSNTVDAVEGDSASFTLQGVPPLRTVQRLYQGIHELYEAQVAMFSKIQNVLDEEFKQEATAADYLQNLANTAKSQATAAEEALVGFNSAHADDLARIDDDHANAHTLDVAANRE